MKHNKPQNSKVVSGNLNVGKFSRLGKSSKIVAGRLRTKKWLLMLLVAVVLIVLLAIVLNRNSKNVTPAIDPELNSQIEAIRTSNLSELPEDERYVQFKTLGRLYEQARDYRQARDTYLQASKLRLAQVDFTLWESLIRVTENTNGDQQEITVYANNIVNNLEKSPKRMVADLLSLAEAKYYLGDKATAIKYYEEFLASAKFEEVKPDSSEPLSSGTFSSTVQTDIEQKLNELKK